MSELYVYTTPKESAVQVTLDVGAVVLAGVPVVVHGRDDGHRITLPPGTGQQGATLEVTAPGYVPFTGRGIVVPGATSELEARLLFDDVRLSIVPAAPVDPSGPAVPEPPNPGDPHDTILWVYAHGSYDLATTPGCGHFVEACALTLYTYTAPFWGHVRKYPGQVQWSGHAIDAVHCLAGEFTGIWDIITNSQVPGAAPAFNYVGPADPALWYPGNLTAPPAVLLAHTPKGRAR